MVVKKEVAVDKPVKETKYDLKRDHQTGFYYIVVDGVQQVEGYSNLSLANNQINRMKNGVA